MSNKATNFVIFIAGVAVGSLATWKYIKKKYEQIAQDEIDSVKEIFSKRDIPVDDEPTNGADNRLITDPPKTAKPSISEYAAKLQEQGYTNYSKTSDLPNNKEKEEKESMPNTDKPFVIPPEEFGEVDGYEKISLTYYADKVLTDEDDDVIHDVENVVGREALNSFGEYEDDSVFVRNNKLKCDYEILLDQRRYLDVFGHRPDEVDE